LERDRVAEFFELRDETTRSSFGVLTVGEVVVAEILEDLAGAQQVPDQFDQRECATATAALFGPRRRAIWRY
jgi:hypothetical protein